MPDHHPASVHGCSPAYLAPQGMLPQWPCSVSAGLSCIAAAHLPGALTGIPCPSRYARRPGVLVRTPCPSRYATRAGRSSGYLAPRGMRQAPGVFSAGWGRRPPPGVRPRPPQRIPCPSRYAAPTGVFLAGRVVPPSVEHVAPSTPKHTLPLKVCRTMPSRSFPEGSCRSPGYLAPRGMPQATGVSAAGRGHEKTPTGRRGR